MAANLIKTTYVFDYRADIPADEFGTEPNGTDLYEFRAEATMTVRKGKEAGQTRSMKVTRGLSCGGERLRLRTVVSTSPARIMATVTVTNMGEEPINVTNFLPWGTTNPELQVEIPDGTIYEAANYYNYSLVLQEIQLDPGASLSKAYDLLDPWTRQGEKEQMWGRDVFAQPGEYELTTLCQPFLHPRLQDPDTSNQKPRLLMTKTSFMLPPDFWDQSNTTPP